jgi:hypothetical protein
MRDLRRHQVDRELETVDGVETWYEVIRGTEARCSLDARHLRRVIAAKAKEPGPKLREVVAPLRVVKDRQREIA